MLLRLLLSLPHRCCRHHHHHHQYYHLRHGCRRNCYCDRNVVAATTHVLLRPYATAAFDSILRSPTLRAHANLRMCVRARARGHRSLHPCRAFIRARFLHRAATVATAAPLLCTDSKYVTKIFPSFFLFQRAASLPPRSRTTFPISFAVSAIPQFRFCPITLTSPQTTPYRERPVRRRMEQRRTGTSRAQGRDATAVQLGSSVVT
ncbi:hypothetical protein PUN28_000575 [Cardiocondyla obscurior]|uniref:Secreted protein n=1 Tax=Cardiocondyla obscurior TaxID=286306 RepID=A0AAW2H034_9HYME